MIAGVFFDHVFADLESECDTVATATPKGRR